MDKPDYCKLLDLISWHFECEEAMQTVRFLAKQGKIKIGSYKRLAIMAGEAESDLRELIK